MPKTIVPAELMTDLRRLCKVRRFSFCLPLTAS
jgi:hypothetical protein